MSEDVREEIKSVEIWLLHNELKVVQEGFRVEMSELYEKARNDYEVQLNLFIEEEKKFNEQLEILKQELEEKEMSLKNLREECEKFEMDQESKKIYTEEISRSLEDRIEMMSNKIQCEKNTKEIESLQIIVDAKEDKMKGEKSDLEKTLNENKLEIVFY